MNENIAVSVIIPAHNEEKYVVRCIRSIKMSIMNFGKRCEIIVVCNRCTDRTEELALKHGARVIKNDDRCIARVRNAGIAAARGKVIITIDCDNRMSVGTIREAYYMLKSGVYIGGGAPMRFERYSLVLWLNDIFCRICFKITGLYCGIFWAEKSTFDAVGGFADIRAMEDGATAKLLKEYGKKQGKKYGCLKRNYLINSTRKFDDNGDLMYLKLLVQNIGAFIKAAFGKSEELDKLFDEIFYDYNDSH